VTGQSSQPFEKVTESISHRVPSQSNGSRVTQMKPTFVPKIAETLQKTRQCPARAASIKRISAASYTARKKARAFVNVGHFQTSLTFAFRVKACPCS